MDFVYMVDRLRAEGFTASEINAEISRAMAEAEEAFFEDYENDPAVQAGWQQQDIIDMYRAER